MVEFLLFEGQVLVDYVDFEHGSMRILFGGNVVHLIVANNKVHANDYVVIVYFFHHGPHGLIANTEGAYFLASGEVHDGRVPFDCTLGTIGQFVVVEALALVAALKVDTFVRAQIGHFVVATFVQVDASVVDQSETRWTVARGRVSGRIDEAQVRTLFVVARVVVGIASWSFVVAEQTVLVAITKFVPGNALARGAQVHAVFLVAEVVVRLERSAILLVTTIVAIVDAVTSPLGRHTLQVVTFEIIAAIHIDCRTIGLVRPIRALLHAVAHPLTGNAGVELIVAAEMVARTLVGRRLVLGRRATVEFIVEVATVVVVVALEKVCYTIAVPTVEEVFRTLRVNYANDVEQ